MSNEVTYHRTLSRGYVSKSKGLVRAHMLYHNSDKSLAITKERDYYYWRPDQRFDDYATLWEKIERRYFPNPIVDSNGTIIGY